MTIEKNFSGRFQIRIRPDVHECLSEFSKGIDQSMNDVIEVALMFCLYNKRQDFLEFADSFMNGSIIVVENHMPIANLVRRNFISYSPIDEKKVEININVKKENNWEKMKIIADIQQNRYLLKLLDSWSTKPSNVR